MNRRIKPSGNVVLKRNNSKESLNKVTLTTNSIETSLDSQERSHRVPLKRKKATQAKVIARFPELHNHAAKNSRAALSNTSLNGSVESIESLENS